MKRIIVLPAHHFRWQIFNYRCESTQRCWNELLIMNVKFLFLFLLYFTLCCMFYFCWRFCFSSHWIQKQQYDEIHNNHSRKLDVFLSAKTYYQTHKTGSHCKDMVLPHIAILCYRVQLLCILTCISIHRMNLFIPFWGKKQLICISMHGAVLLLALVQ